MKFFRNRAVAWVVLVLAIAASCLWGMHKKPADVPDVKFYHWISDNAKLLNNDTVQTIEEYNKAWDEKYHAVVAVASVDSIRGWTDAKFCAQLGGDWGLGPNDMLLLLVEDDCYWYAACGDNVLEAREKQPAVKNQIENQERIVNELYFEREDINGAVTAFFRQADITYAQMNSVSAIQNYNTAQPWPEKHYSSSLHLGGVIVLILAIFVVWALLDRVRYNRYQRRSTYVVNAPRTVYYPVFWGRPRRPSRPRSATPPPRPAPHQTTSYRSTTSHHSTSAHGSFGSGSSRSGASHTGHSGGGFSGKGFGGGKHR